jgi:hypothetical protein
MFRYAVAVALLLATPALAQPTLPKVPDMVLVPTNAVGRLLHFLGDPKIAADIPLYGSDVRPLLIMIERCANDQIPNLQGTIVDSGDCPALVARKTADHASAPAEPAK